MPVYIPDVQLMLCERVQPQHLSRQVRGINATPQIKAIDSLLTAAISLGDAQTMNQADTLIHAAKAERVLSDEGYKIAVRQAYLPAFLAQAERRPMDNRQQALCAEGA